MEKINSDKNTPAVQSKIFERKTHSRLTEFGIRLVKEKPLGTIGGVITIFLLLVGIFANFLAPYEMNATDMSLRFLPPSADHWLGTDNLGRDLLSRVIFGARISVIVGLGGASLAVIVAMFLGMVTGYAGGILDLIVQRLVDVLMSLPGIILMIVTITIIGKGMTSVIFVLGIMWGITDSRVIRSAVIGIKENAYINAAKSLGSSTPRVLLRHILPNILAPTIILFSSRVPAVIMTEASLSFLGFGIPPPDPSWGGMLSGSGRTYMFTAPWMAIWPGIALCLVVYGVNIFGDALRDLLDPKLRGGVGRFGVIKIEKLKQK